MNPKKIAITGGPGSGKTSIITLLKDNGFICYDEISRQVTLKAQEDGIEQLFLTEPLLFSEKLLEGRIEQFLNAKIEKTETVFLDRGIPDVLAYMHYIGDSYPSFFDAACRENIYSEVYILPPWKEIYVSDEARYENYEQSELIHNHLVETYTKYGYNLIEVPKDSLDNRILFILDKI